MPRRKTEQCPFCPEAFATGIERGEHMRAEHADAITELLADHDQAALRERSFPNAG
jgi:hypothetical protein